MSWKRTDEMNERTILIGEWLSQEFSLSELARRRGISRISAYNPDFALDPESSTNSKTVLLRSNATQLEFTNGNPCGFAACNCSFKHEFPMQNSGYKWIR